MCNEQFILFPSISFLCPSKEELWRVFVKLLNKIYWGKYNSQVYHHPKWEKIVSFWYNNRYIFILHLYLYTFIHLCLIFDDQFRKKDTHRQFSIFYNLIKVLLPRKFNGKNKLFNVMTIQSMEIQFPFYVEK